MPDPHRRPRPVPEPDFEVVDDTAAADSTDLRPLTGSAREPARKPVRAARGDDANAPRPRKKKPKKKTARARTADDDAEDYHARRLREFEYVWPSAILVVGVIMSVVGAIGFSGVGGLLTIVVLVAGMCVTVPVTVVALMGVGMLIGIEYGRFLPAVLKIAAVSFVVNGVYFLCDWFKVPGLLAFPLGCAVAFGLFKMLFGLDNWETQISMVGLNLLSFLANTVIITFLVMSATKRDRDAAPDVGRDRGGPPPAAVAPGDEPDDD